MKTKSFEFTKKKVLEKMENLSKEEIIEDQDHKSRIEKILSFAGLLDKVQDADLIKELTVDLHKTRLKGNRNIADNWKGHF
ncbi:hypothetical protein MMU07_19445 [Aquiflexum sp. LQ15W]|uniref:hypothetical protein n=1 Tax=Cognataquiflexum nitidum TaxID=2922272 RepID=UPI001F148B32|nr:hypothetical protein [Cognataquiflexum nitidum]MCH6201764.1 hypothetical protein [Cognataquiflexum nitidum]